MSAAWQAGRVLRLSFGHNSPQAAWRKLDVDGEPAKPDRFGSELIARLQKFAEGTCPDDFLDIPLALDEMTPFRRAVTEHCRQIPLGATRSYGELAAQAGKPHAARAVGRVMAANPFPLIVPCHRVVAAGGRLGGFSAPHGLSMKRRLLQLEQQTLQVLP